MAEFKTDKNGKLIATDYNSALYLQKMIEALKSKHLLPKDCQHLTLQELKTHCRQDRYGGQLLGTGKVAELTGLSGQTIYRLEKTGDFPKSTPFPINGRMQRSWTYSDIEYWMKTRPRVNE